MLSALRSRLPSLFGSPRQVPPQGVFPTVEWQVGGLCNYDCSYCIQSKKSRVGQAEADTIAAIVDGLGSLPGVWDIKMSGGEPFASKRFITDIIPGLVARTPHRLSVLTNFSAPTAVLERFATLAGPRLGIVSASLHLEATTVPAFVQKALWFRDLRASHNPSSSFVVNSVLVPGTIRELVAVKQAVEDAGFRWFPQFMKLKTGVFPYDADERHLIENLVGHSHDPAVVNRAPSWRGHFCHAGAWYFVLDQKGRAYSCRTARRHAGTDDPPDLGSMVERTFALRPRGALCPFDICPCTVPANRGIIEGVRRDDPEWGDIATPSDVEAPR